MLAKAFSVHSRIYVCTWRLLFVSDGSKFWCIFTSLYSSFFTLYLIVWKRFLNHLHHRRNRLLFSDYVIEWFITELSLRYFLIKWKVSSWACLFAVTVGEWTHWVLYILQPKPNCHSFLSTILFSISLWRVFPGFLHVLA